MFPLFETIAIQNWKPQRLEYHQARMDKAYSLYYKCINPFNLASIFNQCSVVSSELFKWKLEYNLSQTHSAVTKYIPRKIARVKLVEINANFDYSLKYTNRSYFDELKANNEEFDELILVKNGLLTDATFANIVLEHKLSGNLFTPERPLLCGTQRQWLLDNQLVTPRLIKLENLNEYHRIFFINAMLPISSESVVLVRAISV